MRFEAAITALEQNENWAPLWIHELIGEESFAASVNDRFLLRCAIAHEYAHDHPGTPAIEVGLCDFSEVVLKFGDVGDRGLYLDKTDAGYGIYHGEAALFERGQPTPRVMDGAFDEHIREFVRSPFVLQT